MTLVQWLTNAVSSQKSQPNYVQQIYTIVEDSEEEEQ